MLTAFTQDDPAFPAGVGKVVHDDDLAVSYHHQIETVPTVLRVEDGIERPFMLKVPFFPLLPLIFCGMCLFGLYSAATYAKWVSLIGVVPLLVGIPLYFVSSRREPAPGESV